MFFQIKHVTRYAYSVPVFCEPLAVRLRPRECATQRLLRYRLDVWPAPSGQSDYLDLSGNSTTSFWFKGLTTSLSVTMSCLVETLRSNPYQFVLPVEAVTLPVSFGEHDAQAYNGYWQRDDSSPALAEFVRQVQESSGGGSVAFLSLLCQRLHKLCQIEVREGGETLSAAETFATRSGTPRDLAGVYNAGCRLVGLPARLVSGYSPKADGESEQRIHAWSEVYLPGAGWRGFDASLGLAVAEEHVPVAAGPAPLDATPIRGTFRGSGARSSLQTQVVVSVTQNNPEE